MQFFKNLYFKLMLYYYSFLDFVESELRKSDSLPLETQVIERKQSNSKLARGVRRLVKRLRAMKPEDRPKYENLLSMDTYKKTRQEKMDEIRVRDKVNRNPILRTEDDLVNKVVKSSPRYVLEQELAQTRKDITACLQAAEAEPNNPEHTKTVV